MTLAFEYIIYSIESSKLKATTGNKINALLLAKIGTVDSATTASGGVAEVEVQADEAAIEN